MLIKYMYQQGRIFSRSLNCLTCLATSLATLALLGVGSARAQEIGEVLILQGEQFLQSSGAGAVPAASNPFLFQAQALAGLKTAVTAGPTITAPGGAGAHTLTTTAASSDIYFRFQDTAASQGALSTAYPSGQYTFAFTGQFSGAHTSQINFPAGSIPAAPVISNFTQAQSIDPTADFDVQWGAFPNAGTNDIIEVSIADSQGNVIVASPAPAESGNLDATTTSFTISADTLEAGKSYTATVTFYKVTGRLLAGLPVPVTFTAYYAQTKCAIQAAGSTTVDTTPPTLDQAEPPDGFLYPVANYYAFPASFEFSESMATSTSIQWSPNIDGSKVIYEWLPSGTTPNQILLATYPGGWPAGAHITWTLNPDPAGASNFRDVAGNLLAANTYKGGFLTSPGDSGSICEGSDLVLGAGFGILKSIHNYQNSAGTLSPDASGAATFTAYLNPPGTIDTSVVTLLIATIHRLEVLIPTGNPTNYIRYFTDTNSTLAGLDAAYPATVYEIQHRNQQVQTTNSVQLNVAAGTYPPAPHFLNLPMASPDLGQDLTVTWDAFTGETDHGLTTLEVYDGNTNLVFRLPNACMARTLAPGSGSAVIPKGTLGSASNPNADYTFVLTFYKFSDQGKSLAGIAGQGFAALSQSTKVSLRPKNDVVIPEPPNLHTFLSATQVNGILEFQFSAWATSNYVLEATANLRPPIRWTAIQLAQSATQVLQVADPNWLQYPQRFYRIRMVEGTLPVLVTNGIAVLDSSRSVSVVIDDNGGDLSLTNVTGDIYQFHLDPLSMASYETVTMTVVQSLDPFPLSGGFLGGVQFTPADLPLLASGTLTVQWVSPLPATLASVGYHVGDGLYYLEPLSSNAGAITIPVSRLGGFAFGGWNTADAGYFTTNSPPTSPEGTLQALALMDLPQPAPVFRAGRQLASPAPDRTQQLRDLYNNQVSPQLLAVQDGTDIGALTAAANGFIHWYNAAGQAGLLSALAAEVDNGDTIVKVALNNRALELFDKVLQHDFDSIEWLMCIGDLIQHEPWGHTWVPGAGSDLLDRGNKLLHFTIDFDSTIDWDTTAGPVSSEVQTSMPYHPEDGPVKGVGQLTWVEHQHYQPPAPCTVTPSPAPAAISSLEVAFKVKRPRNASEKFMLEDIRFVFWPDLISENDVIECPPGAPVTLRYWYPSFGVDHEDQLIGYKTPGAAPRAAYDIKGGWTVSQTGNEKLGERDFNITASYSDATTTEDSTFALRHTPAQ